MTLDLETDPVIVLGDRVQLQQVVLNLLHNAIEAMVDRRPRAAVVAMPLPDG